MVVICRLLRPLPHYHNDPELKALYAAISREIYQESPNVRYCEGVMFNNNVVLMRLWDWMVQNDY